MCPYCVHYYYKVILILVWFGLHGARWFVPCDDGGVAANSQQFVLLCIVVWSLLRHFSHSLLLVFFIFSRSFVSCDVENLFVPCCACTQEHNSILCHLYGQPLYITFSLHWTLHILLLFSLAYTFVLVSFVSRTASGRQLLLSAYYGVNEWMNEWI